MPEFACGERKSGSRSLEPEDEIPTIARTPRGELFDDQDDRKETQRNNNVLVERQGG
jgi:hypothetical protein